MSSFTSLLKMLEESLIRVLKLDSWCHQLDTCMVHTHKYVNRINIRDLSEKIDSQQKKTFNRWIFSLLASFLQIDKKEWKNKFYLWKPKMESNCRIHAKTMICWYKAFHFVNLSILECYIIYFSQCGFKTKVVSFGKLT